MAVIRIALPAGTARAWQSELARRLVAAGHNVRFVAGKGDDAWPGVVRSILAVEERLWRRNSPLWANVPAAFDRSAGVADLAIDLAGDAIEPTALSLRFDGSPSASAAAAALLRGRLPDLEVVRGGHVIARAAPMVDGRIQLGRGLDDVLARAITLLAATVERVLAGETPAPLATESRLATDESGLASAVAFRAMPRAAGEVARRMFVWPAHWRVGYRFHDGPGVAELGQLRGPDWTILPDDGARYYADPFAFGHRGRHFIFVEEYPHHGGKGLISVAEFDGGGRPSVPRVVLEEPHHLSYPQVFARGDDIFMLPEAGASNALTLYRAERFPDVWRPYRTLIEGRALFDATLLEHGGRLWMFASERDGAGSTSDTMVAFFADRLEGPWTAHRANPIAIDRAAARPGGAFARVGRRIVRPVQDGTEIYGGGLGLSDLVRLDEQAVEFSRPVAILGMKSWPYPRIHTLNRAGRLEVIDGLAEVRKVRAA
ncbi:MAG: hypothetical protein KF849_12985 [Rhizobiaceae bacterium]|nr:hypothetical protein [Rhizobiaceae bacterium]